MLVSKEYTHTHTHKKKKKEAKWKGNDMTITYWKLNWATHWWKLQRQSGHGEQGIEYF